MIRKFESFSSHKEKPISRIDDVKHIIDDLDQDFRIVQDAWVLYPHKKNNINVKTDPYTFYIQRNSAVFVHWIENWSDGNSVNISPDKIPQLPNFICYGLLIGIKNDYGDRDRDNYTDYGFDDSILADKNRLDELLEIEEKAKVKFLKEYEDGVDFINALKRISRLDPGIVIKEWDGSFHIIFT